MIWILILILGMLVYISIILRTIAANQVQQTLRSKAQHQTVLDAIRELGRADKVSGR